MRLTDCYIDVLAYVKLFLRRPTPDYEAFRARVEQILEGARAKARTAASVEESDSALFAVVAWLDEAVLCSEWEQAERWKKSLLQTAHFNTTRAGVEFFTRLDALPATFRGAREVYYTCLLLGFKGQYVLAGDRRALETLTRRTLDALVEDGASAELAKGGRLFPMAYPPLAALPQATKRMGISPATLTLLIAPVVILGVLYMIYDFVLHNVASGFLHFLK